MDSLLTVSEVQAALRCSRSYAYYLIRTGAIDSVRIGRKLLAKQSSLNEAIERGLPYANIAQTREP